MIRILVMTARISGDIGWNTYMVGKWHLCPTVEMNLASTRRNWPTGRGFERFYGFLGAETNQWYPELVYAEPGDDRRGGRSQTYNHYPNGWGMAFNTPFKMWKRYEFNGGTSDPCIISWPSVLGHGGEIRHQYHHAIDIVPTVLDLLAVTPPETIKGYVQSRFDGVSMRYSFGDPSAPSARRTLPRPGTRGRSHAGPGVNPGPAGHG
jgi:arylsulfatase A-like enzyme